MALVLAGLGVGAAPASATFHFMSVSEVYPGTAAEPTQEYVELQMYTSGQQFVAGHEVFEYSSSGSPPSGLDFVESPPNGQNQRTILIATTAAEAAFGVNADREVSSMNRIQGSAGAVCWETVDCVRWGSFTPGGALTSPAGTPEAAIPDGSALVRSKAPGCSTLLEASDDTNSSAADFAPAAPSPRPNSVAPTEKECGSGGTTGGAPETTITKAPKNKTSKPKAKYRFESSEPGSTFECALDGQIKNDKFKPCEVPFKKRVDDGKHKFQVAAIDPDGNVDPSPARDKFKVLK